MFEESAKAFATQFNEVAKVLIIAPEIETAVKVGGLQDLPFTATSYENLHTIRGCSYVGAVLINPPHGVPSEVAYALASAAHAAGSQVKDLIHIQRDCASVGETK